MLQPVQVALQGAAALTHAVYVQHSLFILNTFEMSCLKQDETFSITFHIYAAFLWVFVLCFFKQKRVSESKRIFKGRLLKESRDRGKCADGEISSTAQDEKKKKSCHKMREGDMKRDRETRGW